MSDLIEGLVGSLAPQIAEGLQGHPEVDASRVPEMLSQVAPVLLGAFGKRVEAEGAGQVQTLLEQLGAEKALDDVPAFVRSGLSAAHPDPSLGGVLGDAGNEAAGLLSERFGLKSGTATALVPVLASLMLGYVARKVGGRVGALGQLAQLLGGTGGDSLLGGLADSLGKNLGGSGRDNLGGLVGSLFGGKD